MAVFVRDEFCGIFERGVKRASGPDALKPSSAFRDRDQWQPGTEFKASMKIWMAGAFSGLQMLARSVVN